MGRLTIDITDQQHQSLKAMAALQGKTIRQFALERLFPTDPDDDWRQLRTFIQQRVADGLAGKLSDKSVGDILDEEMKDRPE